MPGIPSSGSGFPRRRTSGGSPDPVGLGGLNRYDGHEIKVYRNDPQEPHSLADNEIFHIAEALDGSLWLQTRSQIERFDLIEGMIHLHEDGSGALWIGTYGGGLNRLDPRRESFRHFRERDGLTDDSVLGILEDDEGRLWLSTYNPESPDAVLKQSIVSTRESSRCSKAPRAKSRSRCEEISR